MGIRVSFDEAVIRGWINPSDVPRSAPMPPPALRAQARQTRSKAERGSAGVDPQDILFRALVQRMGSDAVRSEVVGLVPGRRYRADIYLPGSRLVIEFDGFQYHRSKQAFQKDRERQNLFVQHGYRVLRFFNRQVRSELGSVVEQIVAAHTQCDN